MPTIHPVVDERLGNSAYVVELGAGRALVIDPARDPTPYLELDRWRRLQTTHAAETHLHADFLTGSRELAAADGTQILAPHASRLGFPHRVPHARGRLLLRGPGREGAHLHHRCRASPQPAPGRP